MSIRTEDTAPRHEATRDVVVQLTAAPDSVDTERQFARVKAAVPGATVQVVPRGTTATDVPRDCATLVVIDGGGGHDPADIPVLLAATKTYGVGLVIGSRYVPGGVDASSSGVRKVLGRIANSVASGLVGVPVRDVTSGLRVYTDDALRSLSSVPTDDLAGRIASVDAVHRQSWLIVELPVVMGDTAAAGSLPAAVRQVLALAVRGVRA